MKILICYHSETGNTEKVAKNMAEGLAGEDVTVSAAKEVDPENLNAYDVIFLGTGVYGGAAGKSINKLVKDATKLPEKVVVFSTHANSDPQFFGDAFKKVEKQLSKKNAKIIAKFDCIGENLNPQIVEMLMKVQPSIKPILEAAKGHPDALDLENAKNFTKSLLQKTLTII